MRAQKAAGVSHACGPLHQPAARFEVFAAEAIAQRRLHAAQDNARVGGGEEEFGHRSYAYGRPYVESHSFDSCVSISGRNRNTNGGQDVIS